MLHCHCRDCQRSSGGPFSSFVIVPTEAFTLLQGRHASMRRPVRQRGMTRRGFCPECGSPIVVKPDMAPQFARSARRASMIPAVQSAGGCVDIGCPSVGPHGSCAAQVRKVSSVLSHKECFRSCQVAPSVFAWRMSSAMPQRHPGRLRSEEWLNDPRRSGDDRALCRAAGELGLTRKEPQSGRPVIGISQTGSDIAPCNRVHVDLVERDQGRRA